MTILGKTILLLLLFSLGGCATLSRPADLAISNVWVHDAGVGPVRTTVTVRDGHFARIGGPVAAKQVIDGRNLHLLPGLFDMHVHFAADRSKPIDGQRYLERGITTVRDLGGYLDLVQAAIALDAPHVHSALQTLNGEQMAPFHLPVSSEAEVRAAIKALAASGAEIIKIHRAFRPELLGIVVAEARAHKLRVTGHIPLGLHPLRACELGMAGVEHVGSFIEAYVSAIPGANQQQGIDYLLSDKSAPLFRCLADRAVTVTPTLVLYQSLARARSGGREPGSEFRKFIADMQAIALRLHQSGVILLAGSDSSALDRPAVTPGASLIDELILLQAAGLSGRSVLEIAGANAAKTLGISTDGRLIMPGLPADFILVSSDPEEDLAVLRRPHSVYFGGRAVQLTPGQR